jgi:hypothetical protein
MHSNTERFELIGKKFKLSPLIEMLTCAFLSSFSNTMRTL